MSDRRRRSAGEGTRIFERTRTLRSGRVVKDWVQVVSLGYAADGKRVRRWFCGPTQTIVRDKVAKARAKGGGSLRPVVTTTVGDYLASWLANVKLSRSPLTYRGYAQHINAYAIPNIGKIRLDDLDGNRIAKLYEALLLRDVSADQIQKLRKALRRAFNVAVARGLIARNPVDHVEAPRHRSKERESYDAAQLAVFFAAARGERLEAMFRLGVLATMRPGEIFALRWDDVDLEAGTIDIRHSLENDGGKLAIAPAKADSGRRVPIEAETIGLLRAHAGAMTREQHGSPYVFVTARGAWLRDTINRTILAPICARAGLPKITLYGLRHAGISLFAEAGVSIKVASSFAGHATIDITANTYTHLTDSSLRKGLEGAANLVRSTAIRSSLAANLVANPGGEIDATSERDEPIPVP